MWGSKSWIGDFCPNSSKWNEVQCPPNVIKDDPGSFWIPYADFCLYFDTICINKAQNGYVYKGIKLKNPKTENIVRMKIFATTHLYLSLTQVEQRDKYSNALIILIRHFKKKLEYKTSKWKKCYDCWFECKIDKGEYFIYTEIDS